MFRYAVLALFAIGLLSPAAAVELNANAVSIRQADESRGAIRAAPPPSIRRFCSAIRASPAFTW